MGGAYLYAVGKTRAECLVEIGKEVLRAQTEYGLIDLRGRSEPVSPFQLVAMGKALVAYYADGQLVWIDADEEPSADWVLAWGCAAHVHS